MKYRDSSFTANPPKYKTVDIVDKRTIVKYTPPVYDELCYTPITHRDGKVRMVRHNDIDLLLHSEKLQVLGDDVARAVVEQFRADVSKSNPYKDFTDEQLMETVKSRYVQTPAELDAWMSILGDKMEKLNMDIEAAQAVQQEQQEQQEKKEQPQVE